jgi:hypothetical protein
MSRGVHKTIRRGRLSGRTAIAVTLLCFPLFLACVHLGIRGGFRLWRAFVDNTFNPGDSVHVVVFANVGTLALAYLASRFLYCRLRWKLIEYDGTYCWNCGYNLTGNTSGRCPECGEAI